MTAEDFNQSLIDENANDRATELTKREYFAGLAMQGLLADSEVSCNAAIVLAVEAADALLKELQE